MYSFPQNNLYLHLEFCHVRYRTFHVEISSFEISWNVIQILRNLECSILNIYSGSQ